jgi:hypothetical protein
VESRFTNSWTNMTMQTGSRRSHLWDREYYNPLRGLNVARCITLLEQYQRGEMADPQWVYHFIEQSDADLFAILERREAALLQLDWEVRIASGPGQPAKCDESLAREQAAVFRETYDGIDNLYEAIAHLQLATFRGFAHCEKVRNARGDIFHLELIDQWHLVRNSWRGGWKYNPQALSTNFDSLSDDLSLDPADFLIRERDRHVNRLALLKFIRASLSEKDWDAFIEIYGIPSGVIVGPSSVPAEQEDAYRLAARAIAEGGSGYLPHGSDYQPNDFPRGTDPFRPRLDYLTEKLVLAGTGGLLTMLAQSGTGTLAGSAHQEAFDSIARGEARQISEILQRQLDREVLARHFPKRPVLAYFELIAHEPLAPGAVAEQARKFATADYRMERRQLEELSGYRLREIAAKEGPGQDAEIANRASERGDRLLSAQLRPEEIERWVTIDGRHVPIRKRQAAAGAAPTSGFFPSLAAEAESRALKFAAFTQDLGHGIGAQIGHEIFVESKRREASTHLHRALALGGTVAGHEEYSKYLRLRKEANQLEALLRPIAQTPDENAKLLRAAAEEAFPLFGADPRAQNPAAQVGRGIGDVVAAAPLAALSLPLAVFQMAGTTYEETYGARERELRAAGETNPARIADEAHRAASTETVKAAPALAAYMVGGKLASGAVAKLLPKASPLLRGLAGAASASATNVAVGAADRSVRAAAEGKTAHEIAQVAMPNLQQATVDGTWGMFHGGREVVGAARNQLPADVAAMSRRSNGAAHAAEEPMANFELAPEQRLSHPDPEPPAPPPRRHPASAYMSIEFGGENKAPAKRIRQLIEIAHETSGLRPATVVEQHPRIAEPSYDPVLRRIKLPQDSAIPHYHAAHEAAHWIDHGNSGDANFRLSEAPEMGAWRQAIINSPTGRALKAAKEANPGDPDYKYAARFRELWARSYAQWLALRTGDPALKRELDRMRNSPNEFTRHLHWTDEEFPPIANEIDNAFRKRGLLP